MAQTQVVFYQEESGRVPMQRWLDKLPERHRKRCHALIQQLQVRGRELQMPYNRELRGDICELRARVGTVRYRMLYFWYTSTIAVITHGFAKKTSAVPNRDMQSALRRKHRFEQNPTLHTQEIDYA